MIDSKIPYDWFFFILFIIASAMALWAFYFWWKKKRYIRERFVFTGFSALLGLGVLFLGSLSLDISIPLIYMNILLLPLGFQFKPSSLSAFDAALFTFVYGLLIYAFLQIMKHWDGQKSQAQHEQEQNCESPSVPRDIALLLSFKREKLKPYEEVVEQYNTILDKPESLTWHERARQLWLLRNRSYLFDDSYDPARKFWLGEEKNTGALAFLVCYHDMPSENALSELKDYASKVAERGGQKEIELIIAVKSNISDSEDLQSGCRIKYISEETLLKDLVDFSDYFDDIRYRVEREELVDSKLTLQDTYTPSFYQFKKNGDKQSELLEDYICTWLNENSPQQLALLGEYGQGKSTASLILSYNLINQAKVDALPPRIPILIELRGKSLRNLSAEELLATWAYRYHIDTMALLHLHMAGCLLLIFEGFDEIDLSGDTEARVSHFRSLWGLNYDHAKIIITGRPNFFLDSSEIKRSLGTEEQTRTLYLAPFDKKQIKYSLRAIGEQTRAEILTMVDQDLKFYEVVARPSLLYIVAILWQQKKLSEYQHINSALVIDLFIKKTLERQQEKHDERPFMVLNNAERHYFMAGIAAFMAANGLPNQITKQQLEEAVSALVKIIPDIVSKSVSTVKNEDSSPLRSEIRLKWQTQHDEIMNKIQTDVRSCGLLVTDFSKDGTFKFAHKSFMELLQAQVISYLFDMNEVEHSSGLSIVNTWKLKVNDLESSDEAIGFFAELLKECLYKEGVIEKLAVAKSLWNILVLEKSPGKNKFVSFLTSFQISVASKIAMITAKVLGEKRLPIFKKNQKKTFKAHESAWSSLSSGYLLARRPATLLVLMTLPLITIPLKTSGYVNQAPFIAVFIAVFLALTINYVFSFILFLVLAFLSHQCRFDSIYNKICLWNRVCQNLNLPSDVINNVAGKGMDRFIVKREVKDERTTNGYPSNE